jgi:hypothetical protein
MHIIYLCIYSTCARLAALSFRAAAVYLPRLLLLRRQRLQQQQHKKIHKMLFLCVFLFQNHPRRIREQRQRHVAVGQERNAAADLALYSEGKLNFFFYFHLLFITSQRTSNAINVLAGVRVSIKY